jgi:hypothetical protein
LKVENVGRAGAARFRPGPDDLTDETLDELGHVLSAPTTRSRAS